MTDRLAMYNANTLKLGLFGANCSSGRSATKVPERWSASWADCLALAKMGDEAGIDFLLPIGRWKGYGGDTDLHGETLETITWATGLLAATSRVTVFGTVHAPLFHPIIAAKEMVTADQIGEGRFGLNIVVGWNEDEFEMFGVAQRDHEARYDYAQEWIDAIKLIWSEREDFDFAGRYINLKGVRAKPKPYGGSRPIIMNAGASPTGQAFAVKNCDAFFMQASRVTVAETAERVGKVKHLAQQQGARSASIPSASSPAGPRCARLRIITVIASWIRPRPAVDRLLAMCNITPRTVSAEEFAKQRSQFAHGNSGLPIIGDPDHVARQLIDLSSAGLTGIAVSLVNYADELPYLCDEVLPRLERAGLRERQ